MSDMKTRLAEDLALRNAAKRLVKKDLHNLRSDVEDRGVAARVAVRMQEGAEGLMDDGKQFARENPSQLGAGIALGASLLVGWLFRDQLSELIERHWHHVEELTEKVTSGDG
ncbi:hypothetical protein [Erythrobacter alti]|uniref:hypothetical protein n=1 Tax=Erythrobacter alti TaxID=1896145 RepID=UPI0030F393D2